MPVRHTISELVGFSERGPGTDSERRAGLWLADELRRAGRDVSIETFWCRPNWALAHAWHVGLALIGTLLSVPFPRVGLALLLVALLCLLADEWFGVSPGRRLTPERASQNVVSHAPAAHTQGPPRRARLLVVSNYDAGRTGLIYSRRLTTLRLALRRLSGGRAPGWLAWLAVTCVWLAVIALVRGGGDRGTVVGVLQLVPAASLIIALAALLEAAGAPYGPAAADNGSGTATALALVRALDAAPPRHLEVELVLCGAHEGGGIGLRHHLRAERSAAARRGVVGKAGRIRRRIRSDQPAPDQPVPDQPVPGDLDPGDPGQLIVIGVAASAVGAPCWWRTDGPALPRRHSSVLDRLAQQVAALRPTLAARPHLGHGRSPAQPAQTFLPRLRRPRPSTIAVGALDARGGVPHSHQPADGVDAIDEIAADQMLEFALVLVDAIDAEVSRDARQTRRRIVPA